MSPLQVYSLRPVLCAFFFVIRPSPSSFSSASSYPYARHPAPSTLLEDGLPRSASQYFADDPSQEWPDILKGREDLLSWDSGREFFGDFGRNWDGLSNSRDDGGRMLMRAKREKRETNDENGGEDVDSGDGSGGSDGDGSGSGSGDGGGADEDGSTRMNGLHVFAAARQEQEEAAATLTAMTAEAEAERELRWARENISLRLQSNFIPIDYELLFLVDPETNNRTVVNGIRLFSGHVRLRLQARSNASIIILHARNLLIEKQNVQIRHVTNFNYDNNGEDDDNNDDELHVTKLLLTKEELLLKTNDTIEAGSIVQVSIWFRGGHSQYSSDRRGFFYGSRKVAGKKYEGLFTQFDPIDARTAFPCIDQPEYKAKFKVTILCKDPFHALSNMKILEGYPKYVDRINITDKLLQSEIVADFLEANNKFGRKVRVFRFAETPVMSAYLLAMTVTTFAHVETTTKEGLLIRVWAPPEWLWDSQFTLDVIVKSFHFLENKLQIKYPLSKLDFSVVFNLSYKIGAMENWGLIIHKPNYLLKSSESSSRMYPNLRSDICTSVGHELSHLWFGNLLTMEWWDDVWLKESFATYYEQLTTETEWPEFHVTNPNLWVMPDSQAISRPVVRKPYSTAYEGPPVIEDYYTDSNIIFRQLDYNTVYLKGGALVALLRDSIGADKWDERMSAYLRRHSYTTAKTRDLVNAIQNATEEFSVEEVVDSWITQESVPLVTILRKYGDGKRGIGGSDDGDDNSRTNSRVVALFSPITITQRSLYYPRLVGNQRWTLRVKLDYLDVESNVRKSRVVWMPRNMSSVTLTDVPANENSFIVALNDQLTLHDYDERNWRQIVDALRINSSSFRAEEKFAFLQINCHVRVVRYTDGERAAGGFESNDEEDAEETETVEGLRAYRCLEIGHWLKDDRDSVEYNPTNLDRFVPVSPGFSRFLPQRLAWNMGFLKRGTMRKAIERFIGSQYVAKWKLNNALFALFKDLCLFPVAYEQFYPDGISSLTLEIKENREILRKERKNREYLKAEDEYFLSDVELANTKYVDETDEVHEIYDDDLNDEVKSNASRAEWTLHYLHCAMVKYGAEKIEEMRGRGGNTSIWDLYYRRFQDGKTVAERTDRFLPLLCVQNAEKMDQLFVDMREYFNRTGGSNLYYPIKESFLANPLALERLWEHLRVHSATLKEEPFIRIYGFRSLIFEIYEMTEDSDGELNKALKEFFGRKRYKIHPSRLYLRNIQPKLREFLVGHGYLNSDDIDGDGDDTS